MRLTCDYLKCAVCFGIVFWLFWVNELDFSMWNELYGNVPVFWFSLRLPMGFMGRERGKEGSWLLFLINPRPMGTWKKHLADVFQGWSDLNPVSPKSLCCFLSSCHLWSTSNSASCFEVAGKGGNKWKGREGSIFFCLLTPKYQYIMPSSTRKGTFLYLGDCFSQLKKWEGNVDKRMPNVCRLLHFPNRV